MTQIYDLLVLGAGPACHPAARLFREAGRAVAVIEAGALGGVCPHTGCNPKKVLMAAAEAVHAARHLAGKGLVGEPCVDWTALMAFKRGFTAPVDARVATSYKAAGIELIRGRGVLAGKNTIRVGETAYTGKKILIAVGAYPQPFHFPGHEHLATSDAFLDADALPERLAFIGGGFIAFELAHLAALCGAKKITILTHGDMALRRFDQDAVSRLLEATRGLGIDVRLNAPVSAITQTPGGLRVETPAATITADMVVNAAGRPAAIDALGLETAGVTSNTRGIAVNQYLQTANPDIYAAGDCLDAPYALTPTADLESKVAGRNMLAGNSTPIDRTGTPSVLFTQPPLAMAGLTEAQCQAQNIPYAKKEYDLADAFPWKRLGETVGYSKILTAPETGRILGAHVLGHDAEEIINAVALAMRNKLPAQALADAIWAYPTCGYYLRYMV